MTPSIPVLLYHWMDDGARCSADRRCTVSRASFEAHEDVIRLPARIPTRVSDLRAALRGNTPLPEEVVAAVFDVRRRQPGTRLGWGA